MNAIKCLGIFLSISLGANMWFIWRDYNKAQLANNKPNYFSQTSNNEYLYNNSTKNSKTHVNELDAQPITTDFLKPSSTHHNQTNTEDNFRNNQVLDLEHLQILASNHDFQTLEYEVSAYLRIHPQDISAMLLEAQAYYHNKPLNIALVHYQELLSQPLNNEQRQDVKKIIAVNTTRIIQQFSGDGAWDLLAKFLEPLIQIDPLNRQYLMALAHAYGMQEQFTLMEDTLASFAANDVRANRLRDEVLGRLERQKNGQQQEPQLAQAQPLEEPLKDRVADVSLQQTRGHFMTQARVHDTVVNLLVDTGASTTAISDIKFDSIAANQVEFLGLFNVNTAGGTIEAPIYKIKQFVLGQRTLSNISVLVLPSENLSRYDGLLGMNVLSQFDLAYDAASQTMKMYKKH